MPALLTTTQSRWLLSLLVGFLSAIAIGSSAPAIAGGESMYSGRPGDIRGMVVVLGCTGLGIIGLSRLAQIMLPKPWRIYADRMEFTSVAMLWICWTSATMSFSSFTLGQGVCSSSTNGILLPTCPLLTFDLAILHLLSTATLALLLVILSNTLSPNYQASLSNIHPEEGSRSGDRGIKDSRGSVLVMWELAISSPPPSPTLRPSSVYPSSSGSRFGPSGYGSTETTTTTTTPSSNHPSVPSDEAAHGTKLKRDRFSEGRIVCYSLLLLVSTAVIIGSALLMNMGEFVASSVFMSVVGLCSATFAITFLYIHRRPRKDEVRSLMRALEVGFAGFLFLLWPLAAISFTLFPSIPNRACDNPASSVTPPPPSSGEDDTMFNSEDTTCIVSFGIISLAWLAAWIVFGRVLGLVFPVPTFGAGGSSVGTGSGSGSGRSGTGGIDGEAQSLLAHPHPSRNEVRRPQVGWGRIVAGEAFELGDDDDIDDH